LKTGVQAIIRTIRSDAEQHSSERYTKIKSDVDREIEEDIAHITDDYKKRCEALKKHNELEYSKMLERMQSRLSRETLTYRRYLIDEIFKMAITKLRNITEKEFSRIFKAAVKGLQGNFSVLIGEHSAGGYIEELIKEIGGENPELKIVWCGGVVPGKSGFILRDDRIEINCLFEDLIEDRKNEEMAEVIVEVFES
jgi:vacuolar-type H+-ATPase subunit E/Vma4